MEWWYQSAEERMSAPTVYPPPPPPPPPQVNTLCVSGFVCVFVLHFNVNSQVIMTKTGSKRGYSSAARQNTLSLVFTEAGKSIRSYSFRVCLLLCLHIQVRFSGEASKKLLNCRIQNGGVFLPQHLSFGCVLPSSCLSLYQVYLM